MAERNGGTERRNGKAERKGGTERRNGMAERNGDNEDKTRNWGLNKQLLRGNRYYMTGWDKTRNHSLTINRGK